MLRFVQLILQRRNVTDLGIRRASPARVSPGSAVGSAAGRGWSPVRTTRATAQSAASKKSPTRLQNGTCRQGPPALPEPTANLRHLHEQRTGREGGIRYGPV